MNSLFTGIGRFESGTYAEVFRGTHVLSGEQVVFKVIRAVPQSLPKKALHISLRGCETFADILREVRITRYDYDFFFPLVLRLLCLRAPLATSPSPYHC